MKKVITIILIAMLLSSCGIGFGDFHRWEEVHGNKNCSRNW